MTYLIEEFGYRPEDVGFFGSKFMMGNGYLGYRGTLEECGKRELCACTLSGLYDQNGSRWREIVNAPNPLLVTARLGGASLSVLERTPERHVQRLDVSIGIHSRETQFSGGAALACRRFASLDDVHLLVLECRVTAGQGGDAALAIAIDTDIWDCNGPHLECADLTHRSGALVYSARTMETKTQVAVAQAVVCPEGEIEETANGFVVHRTLADNESMTVCIFAAIYKDTDPGTENPADAALAAVQSAAALGFHTLLEKSAAAWARLWENVGVAIEGDGEADLALRYSQYLLLISTPFHTDAVAIPARGLSGQVYKGAMFWDTELYMLPMFNCCLPATARNLTGYRVRTLGGARRKAAQYGYRGAFYPWEAQETGEDGCTEYNLNDIFTGRPMRTYFRDKQIHISADVVYGIWQYYLASGDESILLKGGAETILECVRFLYSYSYFKSDKGRYELLDVTGADEYHERVNNDAYTNILTQKALDAAQSTVILLRERHPAEWAALDARLDWSRDEAAIADFVRKLYIPAPDPATGLVEQYDGCFGMEDITPAELQKRELMENEYWGSPCGLAVNTQVLKQADVVLCNALFPGDYTKEQLRANFRYYEPRTEHGSSLSTCIYALSAARCGLTDYALRYFLRAARLDLTGDYKRYLGDLYIGGTHPAANGGSWMVAVQGFGGLRLEGERVFLEPNLPIGWTALSFRVHWQGMVLDVRETSAAVTVSAHAENAGAVPLDVAGQCAQMNPGQTLTIEVTK